jgi:hypothetical protein
MSTPPFPGAAFAGDPEEVWNPNEDLAIEDTTVARPDLATDERVIAEEVFDSLVTRSPGWVAHDGNLDVWIIEAFARAAAEIRGQVADVPDAIFATYGVEVLGIPIAPPRPATGTSIWTAVDELGYRIPAATQFTLARTGDDLVAFEVLEAAEIPRDETQVAGVRIRALEDGVDGNGLRGEGEIVDPLAWVESIVVDPPTTNGFDGQSMFDYLREIVGLLRMIALRPVLPGDFALLALRVPGVGRAIAMDLYDPATDTWGHERTITLVVTDPNGQRCPQPVKDEVKATLQALRETTFLVNVIDAKYQPVDVSYEVTAFAEQNPDVVQAACDEQLTAALSPANYRLGTTSPAITGGEVIPPPRPGEQPGRRFVRRNDTIGLLDRSRGVDWVDDVELDGQHGDVELGSPTTLPQPGTIAGTVNEQ